MKYRHALAPALAIAAGLVFVAQPAEARKKKDLPPPTGTLIENVSGLTPDGKGGVERFEALLIGEDGRIADVYAANDKRPERVAYKLDGAGRVMVPGMIDAHGHVMATGFARMTLDLSMTTSLDEALARIAAYAAANPELPWILGSGWNQVTWGMDRFPTAAELDTATGGRPAFLERVDGHGGWANTAALAAAGITAATRDPAGGQIIRLPGSQDPAGMLVDNAKALIEAKLPAPRPSDRDTAFAKAQLVFLENGVTAVADMGTTIEDWQTFRRAGDLGNLRMRIASYAGGVDDMVLIAGPGPTPWLYDGRLKLAGVKLWLDGALGSRGAWLKQPYADAPGSTGLPMMTETQLGNLMSRAAIDKFQVAVHAIGDKANSTVLSAIDELSNTYKGDRRWRIEHAQIVAPADIARFGEHGVIASMQPQHEASDRIMAEQRLGPNRLTGAYAWKSLQNAGATLAFGSDVPVEPAKPFLGLAVATSRQGVDDQPPGGWQPQERLTFAEAFSAYTSGAAYAMFAEDQLGRLAKGLRADFLFIDRDPTTASPAQLRETKVTETWINGVRAWKADGSTAPTGAPASR
nr:amidohydrolase [Novosphingobium aquimarinum]